MLFPFLAVLVVLQGGLVPAHVVQLTGHETIAGHELPVNYVSNGVLEHQPAYPLSVVVPVFEVRNAPDSQRISYPPCVSSYALPRATAYGYQEFSKYLWVSLTGVDIIFPFHTFW